MDFGLSEEQALLQDTVRGYVEKECDAARLRELFEAGSGIDAALWRGLVDMGVAGLAIPEDHGGGGLKSHRDQRDRGRTRLVVGVPREQKLRERDVLAVVAVAGRVR